MRFIDRTNCTNITEKGKSTDITALGQLTRTATRIAEENGLGVLKRRDGQYRIIKASGLGSGIEEFFGSLQEVDEFLKAMR